MMWAAQLTTVWDVPQVRLAAWIMAGLVGFVVLLVFPLAAVAARKQTHGEISRPGLYGIVGRFGSGKSLLMSWLVVNSKSDRQILSNSGMTGSEPYASWMELMWKADDGALILMDEVSLWWPAGNVKVPELLDAWIRQLRKRRITMVWASQGWSHTGKKLRDLTFACWVAKNLSGVHIYTLHETSQMGRTGHGVHSAKLHVKRTKKVKAAYNTFELVEPGGWSDVPVGVSINDMMRASGRVQTPDQSRWLPRPKDGPALDDWLRDCTSEPTTARTGARYEHRGAPFRSRPVSATRRP